MKLNLRFNRSIILSPTLLSKKWLRTESKLTRIIVPIKTVLKTLLTHFQPSWPKSSVNFFNLSRSSSFTVFFWVASDLQRKNSMDGVNYKRSLISEESASEKHIYLRWVCSKNMLNLSSTLYILLKLNVYSMWRKISTMKACILARLFFQKLIAGIWMEHATLTKSCNAMKGNN